MSGLFITLTATLKAELTLVHRMQTLLSECLAGYFIPHAACLVASYAPVGTEQPSNPLVETIGALQNWASPGLTYDDVRKGHFPLLPQEHLDRKRCWTTLNLPDCNSDLLRWVRTHQCALLWQANIFGSLQLMMENADAYIESRVLFREFDTSRVAVQRGVAEPQTDPRAFKKLLSLRCGNMLPASNRIFFTFGTESDLWLEHGNAFGGMARSTARLNTQQLAQRIQSCVLTFEDELDSIERDALEGEEWGREKNRIEEDLQAITDLRIG